VNYSSSPIFCHKPSEKRSVCALYWHLDLLFIILQVVIRLNHDLLVSSALFSKRLYTQEKNTKVREDKKDKKNKKPLFNVQGLPALVKSNSTAENM
jgi:hypothetical protein